MGYGDSTYGDTIYKDDDAMHYYALKILSPLLAGDELDDQLYVEGILLDQAMYLIDSIIIKIFPDKATDQLLSFWEDTFGVNSSSDILEDRQLLVSSMLAAVGGINKPYFESICETFGYKVGTSAAVGDPHIRILIDQFLPFKLGISHLGVDKLFGQKSGSSASTVLFVGTYVEQDLLLKNFINEIKPYWVEAIFRNE